MINNINQFPFYKNYYELLDNLPKEDKKLMLEIIVDFMFKDIEPKNLEKMNLAIWNNIKLPLLNTKKQILNGQKGGRPKKEENPNKNPNKNPNENPNKNPNKNPNENPNKNPNKNPNENQIYILNLLFIISNNIFYNDKELLVNKIKEWLEYKKQRKDKKYTEIGFNKLLKQIENNVNKYGEQQVIDLIDECMSNNYQGIIFDKLKNKLKNNTNEKLPTWFDKDFKKSDDNINELENILEEFQ